MVYLGKKSHPIVTRGVFFCLLPSLSGRASRGVQTNDNLSLPQIILEEGIKYERFKMATYVAEFVILKEIVDFRDICGSY